MEKKALGKITQIYKTIRLNKFIADAGICARRQADELIKTGAITVNNQKSTTLGYQVLPTDVVKYGKKILKAEKFVYLLLNKPQDCITTTKDPNNRKTVMQLVQNACQERIYPVGRLDRHTTGLLLLTNNGALAKKLAHPASQVPKVYRVTLDKALSLLDFKKLAQGIQLQDGMAKPDHLKIIATHKKIIDLTIHMGKNRIVRRLFAHLAYNVEKLDRIQYAHLTKKSLMQRQWRFLNEKEIKALKNFP